MPIYMDIHESLGDATADDIADAHKHDLAAQGEYGVRFLTYWFNDSAGKAFCLVESPDADTAIRTHKAAHGLVPHRVIEVDGDSLAGFFGEWNLDAVDRALHEGSDEPDEGIRTIMFTDIVGSTKISSEQGDDAAMQMVRAHDEIVRSCLHAAKGREVKHTGDGILSSFVSVTRALECAIEIQRGVSAHEASEGLSLAVSIGMSAGEPVEDRDDLFGASVNLASRLCSHAGGDEILVSRAVRDLAIGKALDFEGAGSIALKGFADPVAVYRVNWESS